MSGKPKLAVFKFASCDGCQLTVLDMEDELLALAGAVEVANFLEASRAVIAGPYDLGLVEGSITTAHDLERLTQARASCATLVAIGACATAGGIQALRNFVNVADYVKLVYARPDYITTLARSTPPSAHVKIDFELRGCPISKEQSLGVLGDLLAGRAPRLPGHAVCVECKLAGVPCLTVARGVPCLGPVTQTGCGALCPRYARGCYGCFGPQDTANTESLTTLWKSLGISDAEITRAFRGYNAMAPEFYKAGGGQ